MPIVPIIIRLTPTQAAALARVGGNVDLADHFADGRRRSAARNAFDRVEDALGGIAPDAVDEDLDRLAQVLAEVRRPEFVVLMAARLRDLLAVSELWSALEQAPASSQASALLDPEAIDEIDWRVEALDLIAACGITVTLPGEGVHIASPGRATIVER